MRFIVVLMEPAYRGSTAGWIRPQAARRLSLSVVPAGPSLIRGWLCQRLNALLDLADVVKVSIVDLAAWE